MSVSMETVGAQIKQLGMKKSDFTQGEIKYLPQFMREGEKILFISTCVKENKRTLITVTDIRLLFITKGLFYGVTQVEYPYEQISNISHSMGLFYGDIYIQTSGFGVNLSSVSKKNVSKIVDIISDRIHSQHTHKPIPQTTVPAEDMAQRLEKLASLKERGLLDNQEYADAKAKILTS